MVICLNSLKWLCVSFLYNYDYVYFSIRGCEFEEKEGIIVVCLTDVYQWIKFKLEDKENYQDTSTSTAAALNFRNIFIYK